MSSVGGCEFGSPGKTDLHGLGYFMGAGSGSGSGSCDRAARRQIHRFSSAQLHVCVCVDASPVYLGFDKPLLFQKVHCPHVGPLFNLFALPVLR